MKKYLIAGGAGYIGSNFVKYLMDNTDAEAVILDNLSTGFMTAVNTLTSKYGKRITFIKSSIGDPGALHAYLHKNTIDGAFHFAAYSLVGESQIDPLKYYHNNVGQTLSFIKTLIEHDIRFLVFSSSAAVYGIPQAVPIKENARRNPVNHYGATKAMVENILKAVSGTEEFNFASLRYFNVAGTDPQGDVGEMHDPETHLIPIAVRAALGKRKHLALFGTDYDTADGTCVRDYIHVTDLCKAHLSAMSHIEENQKNIVLNLGSEKGYSVKEVVKAVEQVSGRKINTIEEGRRPGDPPVLIASYETASKIINWAPEKTLEDMCADTINWERKANEEKT